MIGGEWDDAYEQRVVEKALRGERLTGGEWIATGGLLPDTAWDHCGFLWLQYRLKPAFLKRYGK